VTSNICPYDLFTLNLTNIKLITILTAENKTQMAATAYLAATESFPLVDIAVC
jgi:hypothetical protein